MGIMIYLKVSQLFIVTEVMAVYLFNFTLNYWLIYYL